MRAHFKLDTKISVNKLQSKYIQSSLVMMLLVIVLVGFQDDQLIVRLAFIPVIIYAALNYKYLKEIESFGPSPKEVIESNTVIKILTIGLLGIEIFWVYYWFLAGNDLTKIINGFGMLLLMIMGPLLPAFLVSRVMLFRRLRDYNL